MKICYTLDDFLSFRSTLLKDYSIGFVPTMGALHVGHLSLVDRALKETECVVVSIFVNPTQFNNREDLEKYPRCIEEDCKKLESSGATVVFIPEIRDIYPVEDTRIFDLGGLDSSGEGPHRPGHFNGVAQVVTRLFDIVQPHKACFGEKDFQQLAIIKHFTQKLGYKTDIVPCPTIRESDGLAMSSRNMLLTPQHRAAAGRIYQTLKEASGMVTAHNLSTNRLSPSLLEEWVILQIDKDPLLKTEYAELVNAINLKKITRWGQAESVQLCTAVYAGDVRLIDNIKIR